MKTKQKEIYDEVLLEEPEIKDLKEVDSKEYKFWENRLHNSIGWIEPILVGRFYINNKDKPVGDADERDIIWSVNNNIGQMDFKDQGEAELYSELVQIKAKLNRLSEVKK